MKSINGKVRASSHQDGKVSIKTSASAVKMESNVRTVFVNTIKRLSRADKGCVGFATVA